MRIVGIGLVFGAAAITSAWATEPVALCGRAATSDTALYFDIAKQLDARILRATDRESVIEAGGVLWTFVAHPASLVLCRPAGQPERFESACRGPNDLCTALIAKLTEDPRAEP